MRKRIIVAVLAALTALTFAPAALADPVGITLDDNLGYNVVTIPKPGNSACWVQVAVDNHRGYLGTDDHASYVGGVARITRGPCAVRAQIVNIRLGIGPRVINDYFPSQVYNPRNNTAPGCTDLHPPVADLYDERAPQDGDCENAGQRVRNPLNSDADYAGNVTLVRGWNDWQRTATSGCPTMATRAFFEVRWDDNTVTPHTLRTKSPDVTSDGPGCP